MTLIELLVAGVISLIAASGMVIVMANTLGTGSQTIQMARLTQEMRTSMQIMSRELKRANYHVTYLSCWGAVDCRTTLGLASRVGAIGITDSIDSDCIWFWYNRPQSSDVMGDPVAAFRRTEIDGIGTIQMFIGDGGTNHAACPTDSGNNIWVDITDPNIIDVMSFDVSDADSFEEEFNVEKDYQRVEKIALTMTAKLKDDGSVRPWIQENTNASRELTEFVSVRNNITFVGP